MGVESYKHQFAKTTLAQWLRDAAKDVGCDNYAKIEPISWRVNRGGNHFGVWVEYPICLDQKNNIMGYGAWDEESCWGCWGIISEGDDPAIILDRVNRPPTYDEVVHMGLLPIVIFDVAVQHKGAIVYGIEVVHRNDVSPSKLEYLNRIQIPTYTIDADWILSRVRRPDKLALQRVA